MFDRLTRPVGIGGRMLLLAGIGLMAAWNLHAAYPLTVDDAGVTPPDSIQVVAHDRHECTAGTNANSFLWSVTTGLMPRLEGSIDGGYGWRKTPGASSRYGLLDMDAALKFSILNQTRPDGGGSLFSAAFSGTITLPTASAKRGLGSGETDYDTNLVLTREMGAFAVDVNIGYTWIGPPAGAPDPLDVWHAGGALRWSPTSRWLIFTEILFTTSGENPGCDNLTELRAGAQYALSALWFLGGSIGRTIQGSPDSTSVDFGFSYIH